MITLQRITPDHPFYAQERELRNAVLLRPIGIPDHSWEMHDARSWHFIAVEGATVIGCVVLIPVETHKAQFIQMAIDPACQGQGIGRKLIAEMIGFAASENIKEVLCHARDNVVGFYEKLGFEAFGDPFTEVGVVHRYMRIRL